MSVQPQKIPTGIYLSSGYGIVYITYQPDVGPKYVKLNAHSKTGTYTYMKSFSNDTTFTAGLTLLKETHIPVGSTVSELYPEYFI